MSALPDHWIVRWLERGVLFLALLYLGMHTMPRAWGKLNTDFPNYYLAAQLAHEGSDTSRLYEWVWIQRQKDHRALDIPTIGIIPLTPFSTLVMWPISGLSALAAKHVWLLVNLALLIPLGWLIRSMTELTYPELTYRRIALVVALSFPLHKNLLFGQFYLVLLVLLVAACWAYLRELYVLAGILVAVAAACKIFPALLLVFFLQRRAWRALVSAAVTGLAAAAVSVAAFGWNLHRTYLNEILPWTLHGEGLPPYVTSSASISSLLHYLLLQEPQWNPHPWHDSPLYFSLLQATLPMLVLAPAILLIRREDRSTGRILLEWSALLTASLAISTNPASYHFVLMVLPVCVLAARFLERKQYGWLAVLLVVYLGIGFPMPSPTRMMGPAILLYIPRLPLMLALLLGIYALLWRNPPARHPSWEWTQYAWAALMVASVALNVRSTLTRERAVREEYAYRVPLPTQALLFANPAPAGTGVRYVVLRSGEYRLVTEDHDSESIDPSQQDDLSFGSGPGHLWAERALSPQSKIVDVQDRSGVAIDNAREPMLSADGQSLAFVRDSRGRGQLMVRNAIQSSPIQSSPIQSSAIPSDDAAETALTPASLNLYEASFRSKEDYAFSAVQGSHPPQIYLTDGAHSNAPIGLLDSRYPALSPDGHWMAYSHLEHGMWNLWVRDQTTGATRRIADVPCNQIQPAWESDSKTLLYGADCGRSLWFTAIARRRVIP